MKTNFHRVQSPVQLRDTVVRALVLPIIYTDHAFEQVVFTAARMPNLAAFIDLDLRFHAMVIAAEYAMFAGEQVLGGVQENSNYSRFPGRAVPGTDSPYVFAGDLGQATEIN